jgi:opacity protein-like surface antigen
MFTDVLLRVLCAALLLLLAGCGAAGAAHPSPSFAGSGRILLETAGGAGRTETQSFKTPAPQHPWTIEYSYDCSAVSVDGSFSIMAQGSGPNMDFSNSLVSEPQSRYGSPTSGSYSLGEEGTVTLTISSQCPWQLTVRA